MASASSAASEVSIVAPSVDLATSDGRRKRAKLLRAWVEISAWLALYHKTRPSEFTLFSSEISDLTADYLTEDPHFHAAFLCVSVESATEMYQTALGAHVNQSEDLTAPFLMLR